MEISIAVIIPVYNVENYLYQCLNSVISQEIHFDEVILVNDGSTDKSLSICKEFTSKYEYFKLIDQENLGLSAARNLGIKSAFSKYIMFLDSDDYLRLDTVKILKEQLLEHTYDALFFDAEIICEKGIDSIERNIYDRSNFNLDKIVLSGWEYFIKSYPQHYVASSCMAVYKKEVIIFENIFFPEGLYFEDNYFTLIFMSQAKSVIHISEKLYQRRYRANSITMSKYSERKFIDFIKCFFLIFDRICQMQNGISIALKEKYLEFFCDGCNNILDNYSLCLKQNIKLSRNAISLLNCMMEKYLWFLDQFYFDLSFLDLVVMNKVLKNLKFMKFYELGNKRDIEEKLCKVIHVEKKLYMHMLNQLPLNKYGKLGIYGTGKHTEGLLKIFEKLMGKITCELIFVDSQKDNEEYEGRKIIHYKRINNEGLDLIIISSFIYEKEMINNIRCINRTIPIHTFYHTLREDIFSQYEFFLENC